MSGCRQCGRSVVYPMWFCGPGCTRTFYTARYAREAAA